MNTVQFHPRVLTLSIAAALTAWSGATVHAQTAPQSSVGSELPPIVVHASRDPNPLVIQPSAQSAAPATADTASVLTQIPGLEVFGAGGVSSIPTLHGLADDRLRIKVDGMDLVSACANHMNPPLSYIDPNNIGSIEVYTGITPVSVGGDAVGGSIVVNSPAPQFAKSGEGLLSGGQVGAFYRSNGNAQGANVRAFVATETVSVGYSAAHAQAGNYDAAQDFKLAAPSASVAAPSAREVGSTMYMAKNQMASVALRADHQTLELKVGQQNIPYQGFPNQRMDMTRNTSDQANLNYNWQAGWGVLSARVYSENTRHTMNFLENKRSTPASLGMPMDTEGKNLGLLIKADVEVSEHETLKVGTELQRYRMNDWWDPISTTPGMMAPNVFWNVRDGQRDRLDLFAEWDKQWSAQWFSQLGLRNSAVTMDTGAVQGYNNNAGMGGYGDPSNPGSIPGAFNALDRKKVDNNVDFSALMRYTMDERRTIEGGFSRKARSPNLYERFAWSTNNNMVMNMINWFGDANGYVGNINLKPEIANTLSASAKWSDAGQTQWGMQVTSYYTQVEDYIDAVPCATVGKTCPTRNDKFVNRSFANQSARIYGLDISGFLPISGSSATWGSWSATGMLSYVRGKNTVTDDNLYNIMPINAKLALVQKLGNWTNTAEAHWVAPKTEVSAVRNETQTSGYGVFNVRTSYQWKRARLDMGVDNLFNKLYAEPLSGAYYGQRGSVWGVPVPAPARSVNLGFTMQF